MTRNWNIIRAKLANPFNPDWERVEQQVQAMMAEQDANGGHIYPPFRLPDSTCVSTPAPATSSAPASASASTRLICSANDKSTPYNLRQYTDPSKMVRGQFGGLHTFIRPEKWNELQDLKRTDPNRYVKRIKQMRKKDNRDRRLAAQEAEEASKGPRTRGVGSRGAGMQEGEMI